MISDKKIKLIIKEHKAAFEDLENYDKTREWLMGKKRIDITLSKKIIKKLKEMKEKTRKPISQIIGETLDKAINQ